MTLEELQEIIREEIKKVKYETTTTVFDDKDDELSEGPYTSISWSNPEAKGQVANDIKKMSKILGKASYGVIKMMMDGVKSGKYDALDLSRGIEYGNVRDAHPGEREFIKVLWSKVRDKFRRYTKRGKLR